MTDPSSEQPEAAEAYAVGYGRPPLATRFRPGRSGNPRGRPRARQSIEATTAEVLDEKMPVVLGGRRRRVTAQQAILLLLREQALKGNLAAVRLLFDIRRGSAGEAGVATAQSLLSQEDRAILAAAGLAEPDGGGDVCP